MSSRIDIQKRCKWCGAIFTAHKTTTEYCSHRCGNLAYKDKVRKQRIESLQHELGKSIKTPPNLNKEYLTPSEVAELLHIGRTSIYRYIRNGAIKVIRFERKTLVRRADIEDMTTYIEQETKEKQLKEKGSHHRLLHHSRSQREIQCGGVMGIRNCQEEQYSSDIQSGQDLLEQKAHRHLLCQESPEPGHHRMV